ncbi:Replication factor A protein 1 [Dinochytrium kinnereticum]|nr:Replication factor A protein 1 [Dinochytrium kinnereticum]
MEEQSLDAILSTWARLADADLTASFEFMRKVCECHLDKVDACTELYLSFVTTLLEAPLDIHHETIEMERIQSLALLTNNGSRVVQCHHQFVLLVKTWLRSLSRLPPAGSIQQKELHSRAISLLANLCEQVSGYMDDADVHQIVRSISLILYADDVGEDMIISTLLLLTNCLLKGSDPRTGKSRSFRLISDDSLCTFLCCLAKHASHDNLSSGVQKWGLVWTLIEATVKSELSRNSILALIDVLNDPLSIAVSDLPLPLHARESIVCGAINIISDVSWGRLSEGSITLPRSSVIRSFRDVVNKEYAIKDMDVQVSQMISKSLNLLVESSTNVSITEWETIIEILNAFKRHYIFERTTSDFVWLGEEKPSGDGLKENTSISSYSNKLILQLKSRYMTLPGHTPRLFFTLLFEMRDYLSETYALYLIDYELSLFWLNWNTFAATLKSIVSVFYFNEQRSVVRCKILAELGRLAEATDFHLDEIVEGFRDIVTSAIDGRASDINDIIALFDIVIVHCDGDQLKTLLLCLSSVACKTENEEVSLICTKKLLDLFSQRLKSVDCSGCDTIISSLLDVLSSEHENSALSVLDALLALRSDSGYRIYSVNPSFPDAQKPKILKIRQAHSTTFGIFIDVERYLGAVLNLLETTEKWSLYSKVLEGLLGQLQNPHIFAFSQGNIEKLCNHLSMLVIDEKACTNIKDFPTTAKRSDVYIAIYKLLGHVLPYCLMSQRALVDEALQAFQLGLHRWPSTSKHCLQILTLSLSLFPSNMIRLLSSTLLKISRITSLSLAPHILEFLSTLARHPQLHINCADAELKRVFGIALQYIQSPPKDMVSTVSEYIVQLAYHVVTVWFVSLRLPDRRRYVPFIIRYMLPHGTPTDTDPNAALDENVELILDILLQNTFADCSLRPEATYKSDTDRNAKDVQERNWVFGNAVISIRSGLHRGWCEVVLRRSSGVLTFWSRLENQGRTLLLDNDGVRLSASTELDLLCRSNPAEKILYPDAFEKNAYLQRLKHGRSASTGSMGSLEEFAENLSKMGADPDSNQAEPLGSETNLTPTSRTRSISFASKNAGKAQLEESDYGFNNGSQNVVAFSQAAIDPAFILLQLSQYPASPGYQPPNVLADDDPTSRAIKVLDRIPVVDLHKIGLVYVSSNQENEVAILSNTHGSRLYTKFISSLGHFVKLSEKSGAYTGGLDTSEYAADGKYGLLWEDSASGTQMIFHATTLMPTHVERDPQCSGKKRHIGNDFLLIAFDESGLDSFSFDTFPGQFNYINIVIKPIGTLSSKAPADDFDKIYNKTLFSVKMRSKDGLDIPQLGLLCDEKIVPGIGLAGVVRRSALHANMLALNVAHSSTGGGMFVSNIRERLRQIKRISIKGGAMAVGRVPGSGEESSERIHKHFRMINILQNLHKQYPQKRLSVKDIREYLETLYDLKGLDQSIEKDDENVQPSERGGNDSSYPFHAISEFCLPSEDFEILITETRKGSPTPSNANLSLSNNAPMSSVGITVSTPGDSDMESETNASATFPSSLASSPTKEDKFRGRTKQRFEFENHDDEEDDGSETPVPSVTASPERRDRRGRRVTGSQPIDTDAEIHSPESTTTFAESETAEERPTKKPKTASIPDGPSSPETSSAATPKISKGRGRPRLNRDHGTPSSTPSANSSSTPTGSSRVNSKNIKDAKDDHSSTPSHQSLDRTLRTSAIMHNELDDKLTRGFVRATMESSTSNVDFLNPVVQVLNIKKYGPQESKGTEPERYRIIISDGEFFTQAMLSTQLNHLVTEERIVKHSVVVLNHFICNIVGPKRILILLSLECLNEGDKSCPRLGASTEYKNDPNAAPPQNNTVKPTLSNATDHSGTQRIRISSKVVMEVASPRTHTQADLLSIGASLTPYQNKWTIRARVVTKSDIRHFTNARGEGKLFSVTFADESGEIRATGFNEAVTAMYDLLNEGSVYYVSKAPIKVARKQYSGGIDNEYEMTLEASTEVRMCDDPTLAPKIRINRVMLSDLYNHEKDANIDVVGVVREVHDLNSLVSKTTQKPLQKRDVIIVDESKFSVRLTLWGRQAETFSATDYPVIAIKGARVGDYGGRCLSLGGASSMQLNPELQEAFFLRGWFDSEGQSAEYSSYNQTGVGMAAGGVGMDGGRVETYKLISQIADENLGLNEKPDWFSVAGTISFIRDSNMWYPACQTPDCNKKVFESDRGWRCEKCDKSFPTPCYRYIMSAAICDHTGQEWIQVFNDAAEVLLGRTANELNEIKEQDEGQFKAIVKAAIWSQVNVKVRAKAEFYQNEQKVRLAAQTFCPVDWSASSENLLQMISTYGV